MNSQNMGDFAKLPAEIRINTWKHLWPCSGLLPTFKVGAEGGLGILRACRQLHSGAVFYLYEKETLKSSIWPVYESWLIIENSHGAVWKSVHALSLTPSVLYNSNSRLT